MEAIETNVSYSIVPRMKSRWFAKDTKVFDLIKEADVSYYSAFSFGNGADSFSPEKRIKTTVYTFDTYTEAETFKKELEYGNA